MKPQRLLALIAIAFLAACTGDMESPTDVRNDELTADGYIPNPLFNVQFSSTSASFSTPEENQIPPGTAKITMWSPYAAFATLGPPRVVGVQYNGPGGWLAGNVDLKSAFQADLNLRVVKGMPIGGYSATVTLTLLGVVNFYVNVYFQSGVYYVDCAESTAGWSFDGLWHQTAGGTSVNSRGPHPGPDEGSYFFAYYSEGTGDFNVPNGVANGGHAIGPAFAIPASSVNPVVQFRTWFEIEYNVSPFNYDFMEVWLQEEGNPTNYVFVGRINGSSYFVGNGTTFGLSNPWIDVEFGIPAQDAAGKSWHLVFDFATRDGAYNDYRGWGVDCMTVTEGQAPSGAIGAARTGNLLDPNRLIPGNEIPIVKREAGITKR